MATLSLVTGNLGLSVTSALSAALVTLTCRREETGAGRYVGGARYVAQNVLGGAECVAWVAATFAVGPAVGVKQQEQLL